MMLSLVALVLLSACQPGAPRAAGEGSVPSATAATEEISVTPLETAAADPVKADTAAKKAAPPAAADVSAASDPKKTNPPAKQPQMSAEDLAKTAPKAPAQATDSAIEAAAAAAAPPPPEPAKSPTQVACEKKGGQFAPTGSGKAFACVQQTRDGGKRCRKEGDCEGLCLARSMTCSPFTPVFGCQDILQQDGKQVTQCIE